MIDIKELDGIKKTLEKGVREKNRENIILGLAELQLLIDEPRYVHREKAFEIEETVMEDLTNIESEKLEFVDKTVIGNIRSAIFLEVEEAKKKKKAYHDAPEEIKKHFEKLISKKPLDLNKLAYLLYDVVLVEEPDNITEKYFVSKLKELEVFEGVDILLDEIITRAGEKREREEEHELKNHEARLRKLETERKKELKKEYGKVSKRAGSFHKTLDAIYKDVPLAPVVFESPGVCEKCGKPITETLYYHDIKTGVIMHSDCAKKVLDIKKKYKGK